MNMTLITIVVIAIVVLAFFLFPMLSFDQTDKMEEVVIPPEIFEDGGLSDALLELEQLR